MRDDRRSALGDDLAAASVALRLEGIGRRWRKEIEGRLKAAGLDFGGGWYPLLYLGHVGAPVRQRDLGEVLGVEAHLLGSLLDQLEAEGLIARAYDPRDRRAKRVEIAAPGRIKIDQIESVVDGISNGLLSEISEKDLDIYLQVLDRLEAGFRRAPENGTVVTSIARRPSMRSERL